MKSIPDKDGKKDCTESDLQDYLPYKVMYIYTCRLPTDCKQIWHRAVQDNQLKHEGATLLVLFGLEVSMASPDVYSFSKSYLILARGAMMPAPIPVLVCDPTSGAERRGQGADCPGTEPQRGSQTITFNLQWHL